MHLILYILIFFMHQAMGQSVISGFDDVLYLTGKYEAKNYLNLFAKIPKKYSTKEIYIRKDVLKSFLKMAREAEKNNIHLKVLSGFRGYGYQKNIWDYKYNHVYKKKYADEMNRMYAVLQYSSIPGISRHHWGTDIDIQSLRNDYFKHGKGKKEKKWLDQYASNFGFYLVYTSGRKNGFNTELWHYTYKPVADSLLKMVVNKIKREDIFGFAGDYNIINFDDFLKTYMLDINPQLLNDY